ncbi:MAG TPA: hypothetical protein ENN05_02050 [Deltaproteobacteria bacterium]|nr:hypothetical protein [Deltaproteobacteria bacterium]
MKMMAMVFVICLFMSAPGMAKAEEGRDSRDWSGNVHFFLGTKILKDQYWEPVNRTRESGVLIDVKHARIPFSIAVDFLYSKDKERLNVHMVNVGVFDSTSISKTAELNVGIRKIWHVFGNVRPFIGGGLAVVNAEIKTHLLGVDYSQDDNAYGVWADVGLYFTLREHLNIGVDARWTKARVNLLDINGDAGGWHVGTIIGCHW